jgi:hypothetical protein
MAMYQALSLVPEEMNSDLDRAGMQMQISKLVKDLKRQKQNESYLTPDLMDLKDDEFDKVRK